MKTITMICSVLAGTALSISCSERGDSGGGEAKDELPAVCQTLVRQYECYIGKLPEPERGPPRRHLLTLKASWQIMSGSRREDACEQSTEVLQATLKAMPTMAECLK